MYLWIFKDTHTPEAVIRQRILNSPAEYRIVSFFELRLSGTKYILISNLEWIKHL